MGVPAMSRADTMDAFKLNKIAGAVLSALLFIFGAKTAVEVMQHNAQKAEAKRVAATGYQLPAPKAAPGGAAAAKEEGFSFAKLTPMLAAAKAESGEEVFRPCRACHVVEKGDTTKKRHIFGEPWGEGYYAFEAMLEKWRNEGKLAGLQLDFDAKLAPAE